MPATRPQSDEMRTIRNLSDPEPAAEHGSAMDSGDDDAAHVDLDTMTDEQIAALPAVRRVQNLRSLQAGATIDDDETLVLRVLRGSSADIVTVIDGADAWDLMYALDGGIATSCGRSSAAVLRRDRDEHRAAAGPPVHGRRDRRVGGRDGRRHRRRARRPGRLIEAIGAAYPTERQRRLPRRGSTSSSGSSTGRRGPRSTTSWQHGAAPASESGSGGERLGGAGGAPGGGRGAQLLVLDLALELLQRAARGGRGRCGAAIRSATQPQSPPPATP